MAWRRNTICMLNRDKSTKIRESDNMFWKAKPEFQLSVKRCEVRNHDGYATYSITFKPKAKVGLMTARWTSCFHDGMSLAFFC